MPTPAHAISSRAVSLGGVPYAKAAQLQSGNQPNEVAPALISEEDLKQALKHEGLIDLSEAEAFASQIFAYVARKKVVDTEAKPR